MSTDHTKSTPDYKLLAAQVEAMAEDAPTTLALLANVSALLNGALKDINWVGFYEVRDGAMTLGPFQGKPACVRIPFGKGVCGMAWAEKRTVRVSDVHAFAGHIACDAASNSEIVLPIMGTSSSSVSEVGEQNQAAPGTAEEGEVLYVLDIDSPLTDRFSEEDEKGLTLVREALEKCFNR